MPNFLVEWWAGLAPELQSAIIVTLQILVELIVIVVAVAMLTLAERKVIGYMQLRLGPNRVSFFGLPVFRGLAQPFADVIKLLLKEIIVPGKSSRFLFLLAPLIVLVPALATWAVMPISPEFVLADIDAGLLYVLALTSLGVYGVILAGWASNSKYAFLGAMRSAAQMVAYEIAMGFALVGVLMAAGSLNLGEIVRAQEGGFGSWNWFWLFPLFIVYFISGLAETNRAPFDVAEGESEIVAGFHVEYSGAAFAIALRAARVREHDPDFRACSRALLRRLAFAVPGIPGGRRVPRAAGLLLAVPQDLLLPVRVPLGSRDVSALPLRPDHAARLEGADPDHPDLDRGRGRARLAPHRALGGLRDP